MPSYNVIIIGAGPAGLIAAQTLRGRNVLLLERMPKPGLKLLATGGGRCNITHDAPPENILAAFGKHGSFMRQALNAFPPDAIRDWFHDRGVPTTAEADGCVFPATGKAQHIHAALLRGLTAEIHCDAAVTRVQTNTVQTATTEYTARHILLTTGGQSTPALGSDGSGYALLHPHHIQIIPPTPALVPLLLAEQWIPQLAGLSLPNAKLTTGKDNAVGAILFTHKGLSGPAALALSGTIAASVDPSPTLSLSLDADKTPRDWQHYWQTLRTQHGSARLANKLPEAFTRRLTEMLFNLAHISTEQTCARVTTDELTRLTTLLTALPLTITGNEGWDKSMVTRGGIALDELDPRTLRLHKSPTISCAGEIINLDAPCGGYNLTWALASGTFAAQHILSALP